MRRYQGAAVGDSREAPGELQRGNQEVALAYGDVHPPAHAPHLVVGGGPGLLLPLAGGDLSGALPGDIHVRGRPEAELLVVLGQQILIVGAVPHPVSHLVEELVVRVPERLGVVLGAVGTQELILGAILAPALPAAPPRVGWAPALAIVRHRRAGTDGAILHARHPGKGLERRGARVSPLNRPVGKRSVRLLGVKKLVSLHLLGAGDATDEQLRVERRPARHRDDLAVARVHGDYGPTSPRAPVALCPTYRRVELLLHGLLQLEVYSKPDVLAGARLFDARRLPLFGDLLGPLVVAPPVGLAQGHLAPQGVHVVLLIALLPPQDLLVRQFPPALADDGVVREPLVGIRPKLRVRDRPGVAEDVRGQLPLRVVADIIVVDHEALELLRALADVHHVLAARVLLYEHRAVLVARLHSSVVVREDRLLVGVEDVGQLFDLLAGDSVRYDSDVQAGLVIRQDRAVPVVDHTTLRRYLDRAGLRSLGAVLVLVPRQNLQVPQPETQDHEKDRDEHREPHDPHLHPGLRDRLLRLSSLSALLRAGALHAPGVYPPRLEHYSKVPFKRCPRVFLIAAKLPSRPARQDAGNSPAACTSGASRCPSPEPAR